MSKKRETRREFIDRLRKSQTAVRMGQTKPYKESAKELAELGPGIYKRSDYPDAARARVRLELSFRGLSVELDRDGVQCFEIKECGV